MGLILLDKQKRITTKSEETKSLEGVFFIGNLSLKNGVIQPDDVNADDFTIVNENYIPQEDKNEGE